MDMSVSPDLGAYCCYSLVLLIGLLVAWSQVSKRLGRLPGQWIMVNTWLLFFAYTFVPVLLFWFLDRTNAVHDTSLFAALLVGFGYQAILSGSLGSIRVWGDASKFWQPFGAWADSISDRIRKRIQVNGSQFDERLLATIRADADKFGALKEVTLTHAADPKALDASLKAIAGMLKMCWVRLACTPNKPPHFMKASSNPAQNSLSIFSRTRRYLSGMVFLVWQGVAQ